MSAKTEIMAAIAKTDDANMKTVLILLMAVLEEISGEIRAMRADEQGLREAVLNGHAASHDADHEWIQGRRKEKCEEVCRWVTERRKQEDEDAAAEAASKRKIRDGLIEKMLWALLVVAAGSGWVLK